MNLWGRFAGPVLLALFFVVACQEDEAGFIGFRSGANKFKVSYTEVEVPSSVMSLDSVRTYTDPNQTLLERRLLVGRYEDNAFGEISAEAITQFGPLVPIVTIPETAEVISAFLVLSFDFYHYGPNGISNNTFTVHELLDSIPATNPTDLPFGIAGIPNYQPYYFNTSFAYNPTPIGTVSFQVDSEEFDRTLDDLKNRPSTLNHKTIDTLEIQLNDDFATRLFNLARSQTDDYKVQRRFRRIFKGLTIRPGANDSKIIGFNPQNDSTKFTKSRVILNYNEIDPNTGDKTRKVLEYSIYNISSSTVLFNFSRITADRSGTALASLVKPNVESDLDGNRYYQSGNPVTTKVTFDKFLEFADTIPNLIFNSVELSIDVDDAETFSPPSTFRLRYLTGANEFLNFRPRLNEVSSFQYYPASMYFDEEGWFVMGSQLNQTTVSNIFDIKYDPEARQYRGDVTDFFQTLYNIKDERFRYTNFALSAKAPGIGISVNRVTFKKENIKLKVFYTVPSGEK